MDYALGKINPDNKDYGDSAADARSELVGYTIQNIYFSNQIMQQRGWSSVEVVSSPSHLPRTGLILQRYSFQWKEHASRWPPGYGWKDLGWFYAGEIADTFVLRWFGFAPSPFLPAQRSS